MARVIQGLLTSPANAHSLGRGDMVMVGNDEAGYAALTVANNTEMRTEHGRRWIEFDTAAPASLAGCGGHGDRFGMSFATNEPLPRVVGGRSSAGGSHS